AVAVGRIDRDVADAKTLGFQQTFGDAGEETQGRLPGEIEGCVSQNSAAADDSRGIVPDDRVVRQYRRSACAINSRPVIRRAVLDTEPVQPRRQSAGCGNNGDVVAPLAIQNCAVNVPVALRSVGLRSCKAAVKGHTFLQLNG